MRKFVEESRASINKEDLELLFNLLGDFKAENILEIGTWKGYSTETWYKAFNPDVLISLEKEVGIFDGNWTDFVLNTQSVKLFEGCDSHNPKVLETVGEVKYDFLFIDGDHSYDGVKKDFEMYSPLVRKGGIIVFHDVTYTSSDPLAPVMVKPFWDEIKNNYSWVEIHTKNSTGMGVIWV